MDGSQYVCHYHVGLQPGCKGTSWQPLLSVPLHLYVLCYFSLTPISHLLIMVYSRRCLGLDESRKVIQVADTCLRRTAKFFGKDPFWS